MDGVWCDIVVGIPPNKEFTWMTWTVTQDPPNLPHQPVAQPAPTKLYSPHHLFVCCFFLFFFLLFPTNESNTTDTKTPP